ncbi:C1QL [Mytilus coruscus]|uniref:C1QL n=1 Tax=Mytilus coruscus TaxID=42192 RepID=A0A6J8C134_MYTCO|nr:C1QL [Mytilus coruscus]
MFLIEKEFRQIKMENKKFQMENKWLRENISNINQTVEELKKEKDTRVLTNCNQSLSSSGNVKRLLLNAASTSPDQQTMIAFTAALTHTLSLGYHQPVVYDTVISNVGNAFDARHGHFTVPVKGVYILAASILNKRGDEMTMEMVKNGIQLIALYGDSGSYSMGSQTIVTALEANDIVWIRHYRNYNSALIYGTNDQPINSFSGALLFQL